MTRHTFLWPLITIATTAGTFFSVRAVLSGSLGAEDPGNVAQELRAGLRSPADTGAALAFAGQEGNSLLRRLRLLELIAKADPGELRRMFLSAQTTRPERRSIAQRWAETDAAGLSDFLSGLSRADWDRDAGQYEIVRGILFRTWTLKDPDAAIAAAGALCHRPPFRGAQWEVVSTLFGSDPSKAFALAAKLPVRYARGSVENLADTVWKKDPAAFLKAAGEGPLDALRNWRVRAAVEEAFSELAKRDVSAAAEWLKSRPADQQREFWSRMASRFAEVDPVAASAWFQEMPPSAVREEAGAEIVRAWAKKNPSAALEWLQNNLQGGRSRAYEGLAGALAEKGIESAKALLDVVPPGAQRDSVVGILVEKWAETEVKPALTWALSLPEDDPGRRNAMQRLFNVWVRKDLAGAAAHIRDNPDSPEAKDNFPTVTNNFARKDLSGGLAWAATLSGTSQQQVHLDFFQAAIGRKQLPEVVAVMEKMPVPQQQAMVGNIAAGVLNSRYDNAEADANFVNSLQHVPASLREVARGAIQKSANGSPERKEAALKALK